MPCTSARCCRTGRSKPPPFHDTSCGVYFSMPSKKRRISASSPSVASPSDQIRSPLPSRSAQAIAMTTTGLIDPRVHDPQAIRRAATQLLGLALLDARNTTLAWLAAFDAVALPAVRAEFDPPAWLAGHAAWFQERWIARHVQRNRGPRCDAQAPPLPSTDPDADDWLDPRAGERAQRWSAAERDPDTVRGYMAATLECTLELLDKTAPDADALHFFRLALYPAGRLGDELAALAQALDLGATRYPPGWTAPAVRGRRDPIGIPAQRVRVEPGGDEWRPAIEDGRLDEQVPEFEIDAQPVTWGQWVEFVDDGGYDDPRWWSGEGWRWLEYASRRSPDRKSTRLNSSHHSISYAVF